MKFNKLEFYLKNGQEYFNNTFQKKMFLGSLTMQKTNLVNFKYREGEIQKWQEEHTHLKEQEIQE